jgi:CubicO group peptidase (beta-lactamase class C family)
MSDSQIVGLSLALIQDGNVSYSGNYGFKDFERGVSPTSNTIYCIGSVTKSFTALAILKLQEQNLLNVNDPVSDYIPFDVKPMGETIKISNLLNHTSGLSSLGYAEATLGAITSTYDNWFPICSPEDLLIFMRGSEEWTLSKPGERYGYLNEGYILLGIIIEKVTGQEFRTYIMKNLLEPMGMSRSTFLEEDVKRLGDYAIPYVNSENGEKVPTRYPYGQMVADGGLMSSILDLSRFMKMIMSEGSLEGIRVVSESSISDMITPNINTEEKLFEKNQQIHYGYGLRIRSGFLGYNMVYHSGSVFGSSAHIAMIPEAKLGVVILCNGGYFLKDIGEYSLALLLKKDPNEITYFKRIKILDDLSGTYTSFRGISKYHISRLGGTLQLGSTFGRRKYTQNLYPKNIEGNTKFFEVIGIESKSPVRFITRGEERYMVYDGILTKKICN